MAIAVSIRRPSLFEVSLIPICDLRFEVDPKRPRPCKTFEYLFVDEDGESSETRFCCSCACLNAILPGTVTVISGLLYGEADRIAPLSMVGESLPASFEDVVVANASNEDLAPARCASDGDSKGPGVSRGETAVDKMLECLAFCGCGSVWVWLFRSGAREGSESRYGRPDSLRS